MKKAQALVGAFINRVEGQSQEIASPAPRTPIINSFQSTFDHQPLSASEKQAIKGIIQPYSESIVSEQVDKDFQEIVDITAQIRSINKQGLILIGERLEHTRSIFTRYGQRAFNEWLIYTFGSRRTPYNILAYYHFFKQLPSNKLQQKMKQLPVQVVYTLATRPGDIQLKQQFVSNFTGQSQKELLKEISALFPIQKRSKDCHKRIESNIKLLEDIASQLSKDQTYITQYDKKNIKTILESIQELI